MFSYIQFPRALGRTETLVTRMVHNCKEVYSELQVETIETVII